MNKLFNDLFGPSIKEFRKFKHELIGLKRQRLIIKRMKKVLEARGIIIDEAQLNNINKNKLARNAFIEADRQIALAYKYLENELREEKEKLND